VFKNRLGYIPLVEINRQDPENSLLYLFDTYPATHSRFYVALAMDVKDIDAWQFRYLLNQMHATFRWLGSVEGWNLYSVDLRATPGGVSVN
jgi:hypothetical protein